MADLDPVGSEQKDLLKRQVVGFMRYTWRMHRQNNLLSNSLLVLGLILAQLPQSPDFRDKGSLRGLSALPSRY